MTQNKWRVLGKLLHNGANLTEQERSLRDTLLRQLNAESTLEEQERLFRAVSLTAGTALVEISRAKLRTCGLTEPQIDLFDDVRIRRHHKQNVTPEEEHNFEIVCGLVNRCWGGGGGGGNPPDGNDGPDFGRTFADLIAAAHADDDEKPEPSPAVPPQEPTPMQPDLRPKAEEKQKGKPRPRGTPRKGGWEIG